MTERKRRLTMENGKWETVIFDHPTKGPIEIPVIPPDYVDDGSSADAGTALLWLILAVMAVTMLLSTN